MVFVVVVLVVVLVVVVVVVVVEACKHEVGVPRKGVIFSKQIYKMCRRFFTL